tara:strand:+ start:31275 stop:32003 length:729 start_codon:yes stop_codon:yes gene_type:complete
MVVFLVLSKAALQSAGPFLGNGTCEFLTLFFVLAGPSLPFEIGPDVVFGGEAAVPVGGIDGIGTGQLGPSLGKPLGGEDGIGKAVALVEGIEAQMFYETDPAHLELVDLCPELHGLGFLAPYDGPDVGPVHAHDTVPGHLPLMEEGVLLGQHLFGRLPSTILVPGHRYRVPRLQPVHFATELVEQQEQAPGQRPSLLLGLPFHLAIGHVALFPFQIFAAGQGLARPFAKAPQQGVELVHRLP